VIGGFLALGFHGVGDGVVSVGLGAASEEGEALPTPSGAPFKLRVVTAASRSLRVVTAARRLLVIKRSA
jgi:hypothetical protein